MLYNKGHQQHFSIIAFSSDQVTSTFSSTIKLLHGSLMKLLTSNHAHTKFSLDPTKRVVWANTQFITVRFISLSFFVFRLIITHTDQRIFMICNVVQRLVAWHSGRTSVSGRRTFPVLRSTCSWWVTTNVSKPSATGKPTRLTQPFILSGSIKWVVSWNQMCAAIYR